MTARADRRLAIESIRPNPARGFVRLSFSAPRNDRVRLGVFDLGGRQVASVFEGVATGGRQEIAWDPGRQRGMAPGLYLVELAGAGTRDVRRWIYLR